MHHKNTVHKSRAGSGSNMLKGCTQMLVMTLMVMGCDSIVDQQTNADSGIVTSDISGVLSVEVSPVTCIDPDADVYHVVSESKTIEWSNRRNPFEKTVEIEYYNTLTEFVLRVKSTEAIADVLVGDESIKDFDGTVAAVDWQEFTFDLDPEWEAGDTWVFEVKVAGSGPPAYFEVDYMLLGECVFYTLALAVNHEVAGTVTGADEYKEGDEATIKATANEGWTFVNWTDEDDVEVSTSAEFDYIMPATDVTLTANFKCDPVTFIFNDLTYGIVTSTNGRCWLDRNLGAANVGEYGDLYQWGRAADGHQLRTSDIYNTGLASTFEPNKEKDWDGKFITSPSDWLSSGNNDLWQGVDGINNPCPVGYRLPTATEWQDEITSWGVGNQNAAGAFASPLKLPVAGLRGSGTSLLLNVGLYGNYWSGTAVGTFSRFLLFSSSNANISNSNRANGYSVRCLKEDTSD